MHYEDQRTSGRKKEEDAVRVADDITTGAAARCHHLHRSGCSSSWAATFIPFGPFVHLVDLKQARSASQSAGDRGVLPLLLDYYAMQQRPCMHAFVFPRPCATLPRPALYSCTNGAAVGSIGPYCPQSQPVEGLLAAVLTAMIPEAYVRVYEAAGGTVCYACAADMATPQPPTRRVEATDLLFHTTDEELAERAVDETTAQPAYT